MLRAEVEHLLRLLDAANQGARQAPATTALEMIGPIPSTVIRRWQATSLSERLSISADTASRRASRWRQSSSSSAMRRSMRGESVSGGELKTSGSALRNGAALLEADEVKGVLADVEADRRDRIG